MSHHRNNGAGTERYLATAAISLALIAYFTLFPFDFEVGGRTLPEVVGDLAFQVEGSYLYTDVPLNLALFVPLGFGLCGWLARATPLGRPAPFIATVATAVLLSGLVEVLQGFALLRNSSATDIVANGAGSAIGCGAFMLAADRLERRASQLMWSFESFLTVSRVLLLWAGFLMLVVSGSAWAQTTTSLDNWDLSQPLLIGNEASGDRAWSGSIEGFYIVDRAISDDSVRLLYPDTGASIQDGTFVARHDFATKTTGFPALVWDDGSSVAAVGGRLVLDDRNWLRSRENASTISASLDRSSQFTVGLVVAADDLAQVGPARLLSISDGVVRRNLTIAQESTSLVVRVRTALNGSDGVPELVFRDVFVDRDMHHIVVRYDGSKITVGIDERVDALEMNIGPEPALMLGLFPTLIAQIRVAAFNPWLFRVLYRIAVFLPLVAALRWAARRRSSEQSAAAIVAGGLFLAAFFEIMLSVSIDLYRLRAELAALNVAVLSMLAIGLTSGIVRKPADRA